jgi:hypothetical protein
MRRSYTQPIKEVLRDYIRSLDIDGKLKEVKLIESWSEVTGKNISTKTENIYISKRRLYVRINSSIIRSELMMIREGLVKKLNLIAGGNIIDDIVVR